MSELALERILLALEATEEIGVSETDSEIEGLTDGTVAEGSEENAVLDIDGVLVVMDCGPATNVSSGHASNKGRLCGLDLTSRPMGLKTTHFPHTHCASLPTL